MLNYPKYLLENLYRAMLRIRFFEESLVEPLIEKEIICPVHLCTGQEAIAAGLCLALRKEDYVFGNHRSHGHYLAKGGDMPALAAEIYGKQTGCSRGRGGSMHIIDKDQGFLGSAPIVAGTIPLAVGSALASQIKKEKRVVVSFFGDGATAEGVLYESLNFAALKKLPIIFACENNFYSTHLRVNEFRPQVPIFEIANPFGIKTFQIDGNDILKVYEISQEAIEICRQGKGPVFIEFLTYRLRGHVGPDDVIQGSRTDIRPKAEKAKWKKKDPIKRFENFLLRNKIFNSAKLKEIKKEIEEELKEAHSFAKRSFYPPKEELNWYVFK